MSTPINGPGSLLAAQVASYTKGQEVQSQQSDVKKEQERRLNQQLQQAKKQQQTQNQTAGTEKGLLA